MLSLQPDKRLLPKPLPSHLGVANCLLAALPAPLRSTLLAQAELVELPLQVDWPSEQSGRQLWFPVEGFVSVLQAVPGGGSVPLALVGHEGVLDVPTLLAPQTGGMPRALARQHWRMQAAGLAFRLPLAALAEHRDDPALRQVMQAYVARRYAQLAQQLLCLSQHSVLQRLARCLLMARDRVQVAELFLTQSSLAQMLGARRESVTLAASRLQQRGLISYSRGYVMVLDAAALHALACPCYDADLDAAAAAATGSSDAAPASA